MKAFNPTPEMLTASRNVFVAMAHTEVIRPIVDAYHKKVLDEMKPVIDGRWPDAGQLITCTRDSYLMSDEDFEKYMRLIKEERNKAGLRVEHDDNCPLLVAEHLQVIAENNLINTLEPITGLTLDQVNMDIETRAKFLDLSLRLLVPFLGDSECILKRYTTRKG